MIRVKAMAAKMKRKQLPEFVVIKGQCLGYTVYRGVAPLRDLASISRADIFDQKDNRTGTQRNLKSQHARKAYDYVVDKVSAFYPEIILNIRDSSFVQYTPESDKGNVSFGVLRFVKDPKSSQSIVVSRLDGNHRLWFVDGREKVMPPVTRPASFCILMICNLNEEIELFRDINDNQMGMNTSHLQNITARLLGEKALKVKDPPLYIVQKLQKEKTSPFCGRIHEGGKVVRSAMIPGLTIANLRNAVRDMLSRSAKLSQFPDADAQYKVIENFWIAVRRWLPDAWKRPKEYIIFKGVGLSAISYLGVEIIDRCLWKARYETTDMLDYLRQLSDIDILQKSGSLPYASRGGGRKLANDLIKDLEEEGEVSLTKLQKQILGSASTKDK